MVSHDNEKVSFLQLYMVLREKGCQKIGCGLLYSFRVAWISRFFITLIKTKKTMQTCFIVDLSKEGHPY